MGIVQDRSITLDSPRGCGRALPFRPSAAVRSNKKGSPAAAFLPNPRELAVGADQAATLAFVPYFLLNFSTRPAVSMIFCLPV
jgi:hypothetical protein